MNASILENKMIELLTREFRRSPDQVNCLNESDAEIIRLGNSDLRLAVTTDSIVEEIASGLYDDPRMIGWMAAMANFSDLAAVGATPLGLLVAETLPADLPEDFLRDMQRGINQACRASGSYILGGDTNSGTRLQITGCAVGILNGQDPLSRVGCRPGHRLYSSGPLGNGNAYAISRFVAARARYPFAPCARVREGQMLRGMATACMDTSDGVLSTLDQLMRVNSVGFRLDDGWEGSLAPAAAEMADRAALPLWMLLAGQHGEFELLFTVAPENEQSLLGQAGGAHWHPVRLGTVIPETEIRLNLYATDTRVDTARIRNAAFTGGGDVGAYITELLKIDEELRKGEHHHGKQ